MNAQNVQASLIVFAVGTLSLASEMLGKHEIDRLHGPREAQPAKQSQSGPQGFSLRKWEQWEKSRPSPPPCFKGNALGTWLEKRAYPRRTGGKHSSSVTMFKIFNNDCPTYLRERFHRTSEIHDYNLRGSNYDLQLPLPKTNFLKRSFSYRGAMAWNQLSNETREMGDLTSFKLAIS